MKPPPLALALATTDAAETDVIDTFPATSMSAAALLACTCAPNVARAVGTLMPRTPNAPPLADADDGPFAAVPLNARSEPPPERSSELVTAEVGPTKSRRRECRGSVLFVAVRS